MSPPAATLYAQSLSDHRPAIRPLQKPETLPAATLPPPLPAGDIVTTTTALAASRLRNSNRLTHHAALPPTQAHYELDVSANQTHRRPK
jgi:hypothetical protein